MSRAVGRALTAALLSGLAGVVWLALLYGLRPAFEIGFDADPPRLLSGLYPNERAPDSGTTFAWSGEQVTLRLPGLDRHVEWTLAMRVRGARADPRDNPELAILADGLPIQTLPTSAGYEAQQVQIPARPDRRGLTLTIRPSRTFVPGPGDARALGVMFDSISLTPSGIATPPRRAFSGVAFAAAAMGAAIALLGVSAGSAIGGGIVLAAAVAAITARGFGPYGEFPEIAMRAAFATAAVLAIGAALVTFITRRPLRNTARFAAAFAAAAGLLRMLALLHPDMPIGDAMFQAHRFQEVLAGHLYFTSVAPGGYLFPYAPGLYVTASAFADLVARGAADMALLRIVVVAVDAVVSLSLYRVVAEVRGDRLAAALAVAMYYLLPIGFGVMTAGNLTNAFAQSVSVLAFALMASPWLRARSHLAAGLFLLVVTAAFLSHTSTFAILAVACFVVALLFVWRGGSPLRPTAAVILGSLSVAVALAVGLYYAHFADTYRTELARISTETVTAAPDAGGRGVTTRLLSVPRYLYLYFGIPGMALTCWGASVLWRRGARDRLSLTTAGWLLACGAFLALGILTPVDMRYYLASIPGIAVLAAIGGATAWAQPGNGRAAAYVLLGWSLVVGLRGWWHALG